MKERTIEKAAVEALRRVGVDAVKAGDQGWPDRLVLLGAGRHAWIEFKAPGGRLRPAQRRRIKNLLERGETVLTVDSPAAVRLAVEVLRRHM